MRNLEMNKQSRHATVEERCVTQPVKKETKQLQVVYRLHVWFILFLDFYFLSLSLPLSPPPLPPSLPLSLSLSLSLPPPPSLSLSLPDKNLSSGHSLLYALSSWPKMLTVISFRRRYWEFRHLSKSWISFLTVLCFYTISEAITEFSSNFASGS